MLLISNSRRVPTARWAWGRAGPSLWVALSPVLQLQQGTDVSAALKPFRMSHAWAAGLGPGCSAQGYC
jgi:hypothetical protein